MGTTTPILTNIGRKVVLQARGTLEHMGGFRFLFAFLSIDMMMASAIETAGGGFLTFWGFIATGRSTYRGFRLDNLLLHFW